MLSTMTMDSEKERADRDIMVRVCLSVWSVRVWICPMKEWICL